MTIEEWVERSREEKRELFGEVGLHDDCVHHSVTIGKTICRACTYWGDSGNSRKAQKLQCEIGICYFYEPKRKENNDGND